MVSCAGEVRNVDFFFFKLGIWILMLKLKLQYFGHLMQRTNSLEKTLMLGKIEGQKKKWAAEDEMVR